MRKGSVRLAPREKLLEEIEGLRSRLSYVEETLRAIHSDEVDAIIMQTSTGERVFTFEEAERPYRILIEEMSEGAVCLAPDGTILYCNQFFEKMLRAGDGDLLKTQFKDLVSERERQGWNTFFLDRESGKQDFNLLDSTGGEVPCRISPNRLMLNGDIDLGLIVTDLRERLATERLLKLKFDEAEAASRMKDVFLATVSHELRTPLTIVAGNAKLLRDEEPNSDEFRESIDAILRNTEAQTAIVEDILDISRIISGKMRLRRSRINVSDLIAEILRAVSSTAGKRIQIEFDNRDPKVFAMADRDRLRQILSNLVSNAIKFTPEGGRVKIQAECSRSEVEISVSDTGEGISASFLPHVFEKFTQEDQATTRVHSGLGLGLAITRYLVEAHGGEIRAASAGKGQGSTFTVHFPSCEIETEAAREM